LTRTIGRYEIREELGRGGMATVFRGFDPRFKREVAVKLLPREFLHDPNFRARFDREATTIASLEHSGIVPVYDFGEEDGQPYLVMRFMPGGSLAEQLDRGSLSLEETARILSRISGALDFAHSKGVIHRDLKPANILFDQHGDAYLADFGIVKLTEEAATLTGTGGIIGTPAYMSPEQAQGKGGIDNRSDLYSLGVILFQMLTGSQPFEADTPIGLAFMHVTEPTPDILEKKPELPPGVNSFIQQAMAKSKGDRFGTAEELSGAFERSTKEEVIEAPIEPDLDPTIIDTEAEIELEPKEEHVAPTPPPPIPEPSPQISDQPKEAVREPRRSGISVLPILGIFGASVVIVGIAIFALGGGMDLLAPAPEPTSSPTSLPTNSPTASPSDTPEPTLTIVPTPTLGFDISRLSPLFTAGAGHPWSSAVVWSPDGSRLAGIGPGPEGRSLYSGGKRVITIWDVGDDFTESISMESSTTSIQDLEWSPDGAYLASSGVNGTVQIWDPDSGAEIASLIVSTSAARAVAWSPDSSSVAAIGTTGEIRIWDVATWQRTSSFCCHRGQTNNAGSLEWSPEGTQLLSAGGDSTVVIWNPDTGTKIRAMCCTVNPWVRDAEWSPDGTRVASASHAGSIGGGALTIWDVNTGAVLRSLGSVEFGVYDVDWSPDGGMIASGGTSDLFTIWDPDSGDMLLQFSLGGGETFFDGVHSVAWSPDGELVATGNSDGTLTIWGMPSN
jgi:serine/threonine-protein kinase